MCASSALAFYEVALKAIYTANWEWTQTQKLGFQPKNMDLREGAQAHADILNKSNLKS